MAESLRVATFNLENFDDRRGVEPGLAARIAVLRPQLLRLSADILCLQEVNGQPAERSRRMLAALDTLLAETPYAGYHRVATEGPHGPFDVHNLVILSRFPLSGSAQIRHRLITPPRYRPATARPPRMRSAPVSWDRPILHAVVDPGGGRRLHVIAVHLRAPLAAIIAGQKEDAFTWTSVSGWAEGFYLAAIKRAGQALETRLLIDEIFDAEPRALIAVCGDFNAEARETPLRIIMGAEDDTGNGRLAERSLVALDDGVPPERRYSVLHAGRREMLDHIIVSRPLLAWYRGAEVHNAGLEDELVDYAAAHDSPESHHAPVVATFAAPED